MEREGRRRRRRERREKEQRRVSEEHRQGMSSDDELLEINRVKFQTNMCEFPLFPVSLTIHRVVGHTQATPTHPEDSY